MKSGGLGGRTGCLPLRNGGRLSNPEWRGPGFPPVRFRRFSSPLAAAAVQFFIPVCAGVYRLAPPAYSFQRLLFAHAAAGFRDCTTGALLDVGMQGDAWSSSSYASGNYNAGYLAFNASLVNPLNGTNRANGLPVRCVQASADPFSFVFSTLPEAAVRSGAGYGSRQRGRQIPQSAGGAVRVASPGFATVSSLLSGPEPFSGPFLERLLSNACCGLSQP